jgi:PmbA protein
VNTDEILSNLRAFLAGHTGFEAADVCIRKTDCLSIGAHQSRLEDFSSSSQVEIGLRLQKAGACVVTKVSESEKASLKDMVSRTVELLKNSKFGPAQTIVPLDSTADSMEESSSSMIEIPDTEKVQRVLNLVSNVMKNPESPIQEVYGKYLEIESSERYWTLGSPKSLFYKKTRHELRTRALAELRGREPFIEVAEEKSQYFDLDWSHIARRTAQLGRGLRGSKSAEMGVYRCLMDPAVGLRLLQFLGQQLQGNRVARGLSCLKKEEIGQTLVSKKVTILDEGPDHKRGGFRPFDSEGFPTQKNVFIRGGVLESFALDSTAALELSMDRNGQATRDELSQHPQPGFHNLTIEPGNLDFVDLERELGTGLRLISVDSIDLIQPRTGQFLASFSGFMMEKGQITHPCSRILVQGDLQSLFSNIIALGRDLVSRGRYGAPACLVDGVRVVGEGI